MAGGMEGTVHPDFGAVTEQLRRLQSRSKEIGGAAVAVYHHGELVVDVWTGVRDTAGRPWERDSMAMSFSTSKGVVATVVHRLVDRGDLAYDEPVATWWPEFAAAGKQGITLRQVLSHQAGLHAIRRLAPSAADLLDWDRIVAGLAAQAPAWPAGTRPGYHAISYGYLLGELIRRVTGLSVDAAVRRELAEPLGVDGLRIGLPPDERSRAVDLIIDPRAERRLIRLFRRLDRFDRTRPVVDALAIDDLLDLARRGRLLDGEIPAANGMFTARALARLYAALATPEAFDTPPLLSPATLSEATTIQTTARDAVMYVPMRWRLGYHMAATTAGVLPRGFGHFGFGGSGAWGDPESGLAVALVVNRIGGTPFADTRVLRIGGAAVRAARRR